MIKEYILQAISFIGFLGILGLTVIILEQVLMIVIGVLSGAYKKK